MLRSPSLGGGTRWHSWPSIGWEHKARRVIWRGAMRSYSSCVDVTPSCEWQEMCDAFCYHDRRPNRAGLVATRVAALAHRLGCASSSRPHPRAILASIHSSTNGTTRGSTRGSMHSMALDVGLTPCRDGHTAECSSAALRARGMQVSEQTIGFSELARHIGVMELDGYGWQASLLAKLTIGSVVIAQDSLFRACPAPALTASPHLFSPLSLLTFSFRWLSLAIRSPLVRRPPHRWQTPTAHSR